VKPEEKGRDRAVNGEYFGTLLDHSVWARERLLVAARQLSEADYLATRPMDYGSIHGTLVHAYSAEGLWYARWHGTSPARMLGPADVSGLAELEQRWQGQDAQIRGFLSATNDDALRSTVVEYRSTEGQVFRRQLWETLAHMFNHGTNHRSEVASMLTRLNHSPGDLDMIAYFNFGR
jgi:uncharacterized damage-inducible protein DinB